MEGGAARKAERSEGSEAKTQIGTNGGGKKKNTQPPRTLWDVFHQSHDPPCDNAMTYLCSFTVAAVPLDLVGQAAVVT